MSLSAPVTEVIVCTTCRPAGASRELPAHGAVLFEAVQAAQFDAEDTAPRGGPRVRVRGMPCMSACNRACTVAIQAPGKHTFLFGDLAPDAPTAHAILACAAMHADSEDGVLERKQRPEQLRSGILAKLPPFGGVGTS